MSVSFASSIDEARDLLADAPSPVVVIPVYNSFDDAVQCLDAVAAHTPPDIAILVIDDAGHDRRLDAVLGGVANGLRHQVVALRHTENLGFVRSCNDAFAATGWRDVVLLNSDVIVGPEWLSRLADAASGDTTATATALTNHGTILSVPWRNTPVHQLPNGMTPAEAALRVAAHSLRLRPTVPTGIGHCCYVRRSALDLVGGFDEAFSPGYGEEVDFSQRCVAVGLRHVCADDVFTFHRGGGSFGLDDDVLARRESHERIVNHRYPWYRPWVERTVDDPDSPLARSVEAARRALLGLTVAVDALCLGPDRMGTQEVTIGTIRTLSRRKDIKRLVVVVPPGDSRPVRELREELPDVEFVGVNPIVALPARLADVIYRPYQVTRLDELDFLRRAADRFIINQLDTIAFGNPAYFESDAEWWAYRDITRLALHLADGVAFLSEHTRRAVGAEDLLPADTPAACVSCGIPRADAEVPATRPVTHQPIEPGYVLCLGTTYLHKNRPFALEVWAELRRRGWDGQLVLAGPSPPHGHSLAREAELLLGHGAARSDVITLATVSDAEKRWLYRHATLVLYPSSVEGFGLVPFEAAGEGVATLASRRGGLAEVLPPGIPTIERFDVGTVADQAWSLLHDERARAHLIEELTTQGETFEWESTGDRLMELVQEVLARPRTRAMVIEGEGGRLTGVMPRRAVAGTSPTANMLERVVAAVIATPSVKQVLSPNGSRRQLAARRAISSARKRLR